ncbi:MAG TPA: PHP domain-containing protein [Kofleriaceae bacterium]|nr:PHP domain-containing protein [Kofleriaceae bacterium]
MRFELHCHSTCSDGTESPSQVAARAGERGVEVFALTDHDTCDGSAAAVVAGARLIRGVEMSCDDNGRTIHVLAYDRGGDWAPLQARLDGVRLARINRLRVMAARLEHRGIRIDVEALIAQAGERAVGRPDLARAMVAAGAATSMRDAFSRHLYDGGPVDVPNVALPLVEALALGRSANAALALAHPHLYDERGVQLLRAYRDDGLTGVEAFHGMYDARERGRWIALADQLGLVCTGGSDWHGPDDAMVQPGVDLPAERSDALLRWLTA